MRKLFNQLIIVTFLCLSSSHVWADENCSDERVDLSPYKSADEIRNALLKVIPLDSSADCAYKAMIGIKKRVVFIIEPPSIVADVNEQRKMRYAYRDGIWFGKEYWIDLVWKLQGKKILHHLEDIEVKEVSPTEKEQEHARIKKAPKFKFNANKSDEDIRSALLKLYPLSGPANDLHYTLLKSGARLAHVQYPFWVPLRQDKHSDDAPVHIAYYRFEKSPWLFNDTLEINVYRVTKNDVVTNNIQDIKIKTIPFMWP